MFAPPLNVTDAELSRAWDILEAAFEETAAT